VAAAGFLKSVYLRFLAKPAADRKLFSLIRRGKIQRIVELGVGDGTRAMRMIEMAQRYQAAVVHYAGIDLFEAREDPATGLSLKQAYKRLRHTGAKVQLIPGDPYSGLARTANALVGTQLLVVSADQDPASLARAWFYVPRMLTEQSHVYLARRSEDATRVNVERITRAEIEALAGPPARARRAA